jgi:hypothetical protein
MPFRTPSLDPDTQRALDRAEQRRRDAARDSSDAFSGSEWHHATQPVLADSSTPEPSSSTYDSRNVHGSQGAVTRQPDHYARAHSASWTRENSGSDNDHTQQTGDMSNAEPCIPEVPKLPPGWIAQWHNS